MDLCFFNLIITLLFTFKASDVLLIKCHLQSFVLDQYLSMAFLRRLSAWISKGPFSAISISNSAFSSLLWQEIFTMADNIYCERKYLLWQEIFYVSGNIYSDKKYFLWQEIFPLTGNSSCNIIFFPVRRNIFLWQKIVSSWYKVLGSGHNNALKENIFCGTNFYERKMFWHAETNCNLNEISSCYRR